MWCRLQSVLPLEELRLGIVLACCLVMLLLIDSQLLFIWRIQSKWMEIPKAQIERRAFIISGIGNAQPIGNCVRYAFKNDLPRFSVRSPPTMENMEVASLTEA
jgi:hypothetical protein